MATVPHPLGLSWGEAGLVQHYRRHLRTLANDENITLRFRGTWEQAESFVEIREALVPRINTPTDYLIALHELGHIANPLAGDLEETGRTGTDHPGTWLHLTREGAAWAWAADVALPTVPWSCWLLALGSSLVGHFRSRIRGRGASPDASHEPPAGSV